MIAAIFTLTVLGIALGLLLGLASNYFRVEKNPLVAEIESLMPGSQCGQCGYPGCSPAAQALAQGEAGVTLCPPGGKALAQRLAEIMGVSIDLDAIEDKKPGLAAVREDTCIGCTRCFKVCPTDAIVGGPKQIHTVIRDACTGCGNCIDVCPTECLQLHPVEVTLRTWQWPLPQSDQKAA